MILQGLSFFLLRTINISYNETIPRKGKYEERDSRQAKDVPVRGGNADAAHLESRIVGCGAALAVDLPVRQVSKGWSYKDYPFLSAYPTSHIMRERSGVDHYEAISEEIDDLIIDARRNKLSPEEARTAIFSAATVMFGVLNKIEEIEPTLTT